MIQGKTWRMTHGPVRRPGADYYLLITLLSFALSVSLTRLFLYLTGYPQLGGGKLHIAHLLWGGLLLFIAALMPLILVNRWVYRLSAMLTGIGVGLFIDEVGKFITQDNDYFYAPAAPIIYAFFLICLLVYLRVRHPTAKQTRNELYAAIEIMGDVVDHDLDARERAEVEARLQYVVEQKDHPELARLAGELLDYVNSSLVEIVPPPRHDMGKLLARLRSLEERYLHRPRYRVVLVLGLAALGVSSTVSTISALSANFTPGSSERTLVFWFSGPGNASYTHVYWLLMLLAIQGIIGLLLATAAVLLVVGRERRGLAMAYLSLLIQLTVVDLLAFYYYQFSTIFLTIVQFALLLAVLYYRGRHASWTRPARR
jgi:hypothetical protein